jgi:hypothetical protein
MARIRSVKPEYWDDRKLAKRTTRDARLLYIALWNLADEHGRLNGDPQWIKGQVFSYDDDLDAAAIAKLLDELAAPAVGAVVTYEADGDPYLFLPKLARHQRLEPDKVKSRIPDPPAPEPDQPPPATPLSGPHANSSKPRADSSERRADSSEPDAEKPALLYVAGSMEHVAGGRGSRARARETAAEVTILGNSLLTEHIRQITPKPPRDVIRLTGEKIDSLLDEGIDPGLIRAGLAKLRAKPHLGPGALPVLVHEAAQEAAHPGRHPPDRRQQATDDQFDRAMRRAEAQEGSL